MFLGFRCVVDVDGKGAERPRILCTAPLYDRPDAEHSARSGVL